jgi:hypothetical protein
MVQVSQIAREAIRQEVLETRENQGEVYRLSREGNGFALQMATPAADDLVITHEEEPILAIPSEIAGLLEGVMIDLQEDDDGARLVLVPAQK